MDKWVAETRTNSIIVEKWTSEWQKLAANSSIVEKWTSERQKLAANSSISQTRALAKGHYCLKIGHLMHCCSRHPGQNGCKSLTERKMVQTDADCRCCRYTHHLASTNAEPGEQLKGHPMFQAEKFMDRLKSYQVTIPMNGNKITVEVDTGATPWWARQKRQS